MHAVKSGLTRESFMVEIVVTNEQATRVVSGESIISLIDSKGHVLGRFARLEESTKFSPDELNGLQRRLEEAAPQKPMAR